jgi:hypothetical protein
MKISEIAASSDDLELHVAEVCFRYGFVRFRDDKDTFRGFRIVAIGWSELDKAFHEDLDGGEVGGGSSVICISGLEDLVGFTLELADERHHGKAECYHRQRIALGHPFSAQQEDFEVCPMRGPDDQSGPLSVAIKNKPAAGGPLMPDYPQHGRPVYFIACISSIHK